MHIYIYIYILVPFDHNWLQVWQAKSNQKTRAPLWLQREDLHQAVHDPWDGAWANQIANGMDDWGVAQIGIHFKVISSKLLANGVFSWFCVHMFFRQFPDLNQRGLKLTSDNALLFRDTTKTN